MLKSDKNKKFIYTAKAIKNKACVKSFPLKTL